MSLWFDLQTQMMVVLRHNEIISNVPPVPWLGHPDTWRIFPGRRRWKYHIDAGFGHLGSVNLISLKFVLAFLSQDVLVDIICTEFLYESAVVGVQVSKLNLVLTMPSYRRTFISLMIRHCQLGRLLFEDVHVRMWSRGCAGAQY